MPKPQAIYLKVQGTDRVRFRAQESSKMSNHMPRPLPQAREIP